MLSDAGVADVAGVVRTPFEHLCRGLGANNVRAR
jgi:hypothetical protein